MDREVALHWERIEEAKAALTQTAAALMQAPDSGVHDH
jgi:hypothetical protein